MTSTFSIKTLGCKLNRSESEKIAAALHAAGWREQPYGDPVDLVIVKSCAVTDNSEKKTRNYIRQSLHKGRVIVTGCVSPGGRQRLDAISSLYAVVPNGSPEKILSLLPEIPPEAVSSENYGCEPPAGRSREYLKIQDGCDGRCSYCVVPIVRGGPVSRPLREILEEATAIARRGVREIVVTGVTIGKYMSEGKNLPALIRSILETGDSFRVRITSIEPDHVTDDLLELFSHQRICPHIHLPLQSGSDRVLASMIRPYTSAGYLEAVKKLRAVKPELALGTDIITGFPAETEDDFQATINMMDLCGFAYTHNFTFSPRSGTGAWAMKPVYSGTDLVRRRQIIEEKARDLEAAYISRFTGRVLQCIIEGSGRDGLTGTSGSYIKIKIRGGSAEAGSLQQVLLCDGYPPQGVIVT